MFVKINKVHPSIIQPSIIQIFNFMNSLTMSTNLNFAMQKYLFSLQTYYESKILLNVAWACNTGFAVYLNVTSSLTKED